MEVSVDADGKWRLNQKEILALSDCIDLDLGFSPVTNSLPIRRLNLAVGQKAEIKAAWLRFPQMTFKPLAQSYTRKSEFVYRYENKVSGFSTDLQVNEAGFVTLYPDLWEEIKTPRV